MTHLARIPRTPAPRRAAAALALFWLLANASLASEPLHADPRSGTSPSEAEAPKPRTARTDLPSRLERAPSVDPLEGVRTRIAAKLGARTPGPAAADGGAVLRVTARTAVPASVDSHDIGHAPATPPRHPATPHWAYEGAGGPQAWARLRPEFAQCAKGQRQSPIDIQGGLRVQLETIAFDYKAGPFKVVDNGHTVQVDVAPGSTLEVMGRRYELQQFHFHRPSEERVDGKQFDMVVHLVHKDAEGRLAVVAVLLERGSAQPVVQSVWNNLPLEKGDAVAVRAPLDPAALLPAERGYYTYMGSLTTPPCSEGVLWMVMKNPVGISADQIGIFSRLYPMNARPIQSASGRLIKESN